MGDNVASTDYYEIDLRDIFKIVKKRLVWIIAIPVAAALIAAVLVFFVIAPTYQATTTLLVSQAPNEAAIVYQDIMANRQIVKTYREIARSRTVLAEVIKQLNLDTTPDKLREAVDVTLRGETEIIEVSVNSKDPLQAQRIAASTASVFMQRVQELMKIDNVTIVDSAALPEEPVKPNKQLTIVIAAFLGLMIAFGLVFLVEYLDRTIKTEEDITRIGLPVLGVIPDYKM